MKNIEYKKRTYLPLSTDISSFYMIADDLKEKIEETNSFLDGTPYMHTKDFSNKVMFSYEIKSNNAIENYYDDILVVTNIIKNRFNISNDEQKHRILNLYKGYQYINEEHSINKETLKKLYAILSDGLLTLEDRLNMGDYYRKNDVYIYWSNYLHVDPDMGVDALLIEEKIDELLNYLNHDNKNMSEIDYFIKSQIAHFYFCYIHPYYDINGRTSRTLSMWYLLNKEAYPFIIFNRAIQLRKNHYYTVIREGKKFGNITYFLYYMLNNVRIELEKEYVIEQIENNINDKITPSDYQAIYYILSMNGKLTYFDYAAFYNRFNNKQKVDIIYTSMLESLLDKKIILQDRQTNREHNKLNNHFFRINPDLYEKDEKIKYLKLTK